MPVPKIREIDLSPEEYAEIRPRLSDRLQPLFEMIFIIGAMSIYGGAVTWLGAGRIWWTILYAWIGLAIILVLAAWILAVDRRHRNSARHQPQSHDYES